MTDGELVIWALGEAGWFEIRPARNYRAIYQDMVEAVELLYFITDIYNEPRKRGGGPSAQLIYQEYAEDGRYPCASPELAARIFDKHHEFLVMCFLNRAQGIGWSNTPIYQSFKRQYPTVFESAKARIEGRYAHAQKEARASKPASVSASVTAPASQKSRANRSKPGTRKPSEHPKRDDNWWEAATIYEFIWSAVNKNALRPGHNHITVERVAKLMTRRYEIEQIEIAKNVLLVHARNLCYKIEHPRSKSAAFLVHEPIYRELEMRHDLPAAEIRKAEAVQLRPRRDHALHRDESDISDDSSIDDAVATPKRQSDGRKKRGHLSVLRPKSAKYSGKGKGVKLDKGKKPNLGDTSPEEVNSSAEAGDESDSTSDIDIDTPTQALSPSKGKRKFIETGDDEAEKGRRKRAVSASATPSSPPSTESDEDTEAAEADNEAPIPLRNRLTNTQTNGKSTETSKPNLVPPIVSTPLPTYAPNGPRDSWICTFDGCSQRIYGASRDLGRELITEHLEDHANGRHAVVGILLREEEKLSLPVK
jgi:hypothetical protein